MFKKLFGKKDELSSITAPEIMGLRLGGAFELDDLKLRLIEPDLIIEGAARTHLIQAVGEVKLDATTTVLRFYTDDDAFLQVLLDGGMTENHIADVKLWYFYDTTGVGSQNEWDTLLKTGISSGTRDLEGYTFERVWNTTGSDSQPVAMTDKTTAEDGSTAETDQFAMLYERQIKDDFFEYMMVVGEEKIIDNRADRCRVISTGFDINAADISIIG
ncbi:Uncharacterised protein [BD1-7 clade bacterium]|uniref:DUF2491 domain-containing protein n=1 Tax=BD1-7 clade bacterium TaxID=2029982 RepID=A0A5S9MVN5_9GAMM|nr:Uncharacterised protein [BD1-7 clade bacterium]CAA0083518.1 Uncharacterised protein [BD1-7 clade bacterium]